MIIILILAFLSMCVYGIVIGQVGVAACMLGFVVFVYVGDKHLTKKAQPWDMNPRYSKKNADTVATLTTMECECMYCESGSRSPIGISRSD